MKIKTLALAGAATVLFAVPSLAHHSFAMFNQAETVEIEGTVTNFEWINPHVWLHITVAAEDGSEQVYSFEAGSPRQLSQSFWGEDSVAPGERIEVQFHPLKDGSNGGQLLEITKADGTNLCQGADCRERLREEGLIPSG